MNGLMMLHKKENGKFHLFLSIFVNGYRAFGKTTYWIHKIGFCAPITMQ